jgi:hypothetical protein
MRPESAGTGPSFSRRAVLAGSAAAGLLAAAPLPALADEPLSGFAPAGSGAIDHAAFDAILAGHVRPDGSGYNKVDYRALKGDAHGALKAYLADLQRAVPSGFSKPAAHAYWINLYNAKTLDVVLDRYPVRSIRKINLGGGGLFGFGPWSKPMLKVEGQALSLDDVEHRIVRPLFGDPMSHYALNCASYSCPNLAVRAFTAQNLEAQMAENAVLYVNHPRGVEVNRRTINASKIYSWYAGDFGGRANLKAHWSRFAEPDLAGAIKRASIGRFRYDWSLNDV